MGLAWAFRPVPLRTRTATWAGGRGPTGAVVVVVASGGATGVPAGGGCPPAAASVLASLHWRRTMPMTRATATRPVPRAKAPRNDRANEEGPVTGTRNRRTGGRSGPGGDA